MTTDKTEYPISNAQCPISNENTEPYHAESLDLLENKAPDGKEAENAANVWQIIYQSLTKNTCDNFIPILARLGTNRL
jgi:hypothetical protein